MPRSSIVSLWLVCVLSGNTPVVAHPVPRAELDRTVLVAISDTVRVVYRLEMDDTTLFDLVRLAVSRDELQSLRGPDDFARTFQQRMTPIILDHLELRYRDAPVKLRLLSQQTNRTDCVQFAFEFVADRPGDGTYTLIDLNLADRRGRLRMSCEPPGEAIDVRVIPDDLFVPPVLRVKSPTVTVDAAQPIPEVIPEVAAISAPRSRLADLLESPDSLVWLLLAATIFGAGHALTPGHGKTLVAAYLIGERGTPRHAVLLGLVVALTHTLSVGLVALGIWYFAPGREAATQASLALVSGLLIFGLGLWLFLHRLAGTDRTCVDCETAASGAVTTSRLIVLGISGGIVPCFDAVVLLLFTIGTGRFALGVPLLLAFSVGMAGVLIATGLCVVLVRNRVSSRLRTGRSARILSLGSAALIMAVGLWLCRMSRD